jgi:hypothetical protein
MKQPYIVYSLSKDQTTQRFRKNKFHDILEDIDNFLIACTTSNVHDPDSLELHVYENNQDSASFLSRVLDIAKGHFGVGEKSPIAFNYPSGEPDSRNKHVWTLSGNKFQDALQFISSNSPMPKSDFGPIEVFFSYNFKLLDINTGNELQNQEHFSNFCIWFSRSKLISPTIFFPFESPDENFWNYLDKITDILPFKIDEKYLRIANVNRQGEVKSFKKIAR